MSDSMDAKTHDWILVLEDDEDDLNLTLRALKRVAAHVPVRSASDGEEALFVLREREIPCVVIMDAHMPKLSAAEVLERVKGDPRLRGVPFVVFSSSIAPHEVVELKNRGAAQILTKPVDYSEYAQTLKTVIDHYVG